MKSARQKGLDFSREVKKILEGMGHKVDGPFYGVAFFNDAMRPIHRDCFGCFDLLSFNGQVFIGHQVSTIENKSVKIKHLQNEKLPGWVWCRFHNEDQGTGYQVYVVDGETVTEQEMVYGLWRKPKA